MTKRRLNSDDIIALASVNCCGNALANNLAGFERMTDGEGMEKLHQALENVQDVVRDVIAAEEDPDRATGIRRRLAGMVVSIGHVHKAPDEMYLVSANDLDMLVAAMLEKCEIDCPCVTWGEDGSRTVDTVAVKRCETAKMFKRLLLREKGMGAECRFLGLL